MTNRYNENVQKLKDLLKVSDPFATEERHLVNIITKAVMPDYIKEGVLTRDKIGQALFDTFTQEYLFLPSSRTHSSEITLLLHKEMLCLMLSKC